MSRRPALALLLAAVLLAAAGCRATDEASPTGGVAGSFGPDATEPDIGESLEPDATEPASTSIPGFDGWLTLKPGSVDIGETEAGLAMALTKRATWSDASSGVLFYTVFDGNFRLSATIRTTRSSDSSQTPGGDGTTQLAGLMARVDGSGESWLAIAVGGDANGLAIAATSTINGTSKVASPDWPSGEAELKLCRSGTTFSLWKRAADSDDDWTAAGSFNRKDMTGAIQVGASLSSDAAPDITARFDDLTLEPLEAGEAC